MLSQVMTKDALILIDAKLPETADTTLRRSLGNDIASFISNNELLQKEISLPNIPVSQNTLEIKRLLNNSQIHFKSIVAVATEVLQADSQMVEMNSTLYKRELFQSENKFSPL